MENASKALIIAGAILLAILLISLGIFIFTQAQDTIGSINMNEQEITAFNNKFLPYEGKSVRGSQVNALISAIVSSNQSAADQGATEKIITLIYPGGPSDGNTLGSNVSIPKVDTGSSYEVVFTRENALIKKATITKKNV